MASGGGASAALLPVGFHRTDLAGVERLCVAYFPGSVSRPRLMHTLTQLVSLVNKSSIPAALWIDGGFLTSKREPEDFDVTMVLVASVLAEMSPEQHDFFDWFRTASLFESHRCNTYGVVIDAARPDYEIMFGFWLRQYGFQRPAAQKGVLELLVPSMA